ncbi:MAG: hypothetical protein PVG33_15955 [Chloroflexota bacterium]|jgi:hypothetical protein
MRNQEDVREDIVGFDGGQAGTGVKPEFANVQQTVMVDVAAGIRARHGCASIV